MVLKLLQTEQHLRERLLQGRVRLQGGCGSWSFEAMGTTNEIIFDEPAAGGQAFIDAVLEWLLAFELRYSRFIDTSLVQQINRNAGGDFVPLDPEDEELFALCDWFHWRSEGIFDPSSGALLKHWDYHLQQPLRPTREDIEITRHLTGWKRVERIPGAIRLPEAGMRIDLGGIGKEYAVDRVAAMANDFAIRSYMISFGRDIRCAGHPPGGTSWRIGLEHPTLPDQCWGGVGLTEGAIAASGNSRRSLRIGSESFGHLLDVRTGMPSSTDALAVWAIAPTCTEAGILASTAFILGSEHGMALLDTSPQSAGCLWTRETIYQTRRFSRYVLDDH